MDIKSEFPSGTYTEYSLWLLPAEPQRTLLHTKIRQLASTYQAVNFEPHVTVSCGPSTDGESVAIAEEIARTFSPLNLTASGFAFTAIYTQTLFIQFDESAVVQAMFDKTCQLSAKPQNHILNPHLSLLYKTMSDASKAEAYQRLNVPLGSYNFDQLRVIQTEIPLTRPEQIKRWRTVFETGLR